MILILTSPDDTHADVVTADLRRRGVAVWRFDPAAYPAAATMSVTFDADGLTGATLSFADQCIRLDRLTCVWYRRPNAPVAHPQLAPNIGAAIEGECAIAVLDVFDALDAHGVPAVPGPRPVIQRAQRKARQLRIAAELGFELPPTAITNDPNVLIAFWNAHRGDIVTKQAGLTHLWPASGGDRALRYTVPVTPRDLVHLEGLRLCPMIVQAYVPKRLELRVTVVGDRVLTAAIHSQASNRTRYDWRHYDHVHTVYEQYQLPAEIDRRCLALVAELGLVYGAIDLVLTPDGRYVFLEINPNGQYLWVEEASGLPISAAVADLLSSGISRELSSAGRAAQSP